MWIILLFLCVGVIPRNNAQELPTFDTQSDAENSYTNSGLNKDFAMSSTTLRIQSGRNENKAGSITQSSEFPGNYPHEWGNLRLVPQERNNNRDSAKNTNGNDRSTVTDLPILFRRPDSEANNTLLSQLIRRNEFSGVPVPIIYFQSNRNITSDSLTTVGDQVYEENLPNERILTIPETSDVYRNAFIPPEVQFYNPSQSSLNSNVQNFESIREEKQISSNGDQGYTEIVPDESARTNTGNLETFDSYRNSQFFSSPFYSLSQYSLNSNVGSNLEPTQISSSAIDKPTNSDSIISRTTEEFIEPQSTVDRRTEQIIPTPMDIYRSQRFLPSMVPGYFPPYPFVPYQRDGTFQPMLPYLPNGQTFDRESGPVVGIPEVIEKQTLSQGAPEHLNENLPSEPTVNNIPPTLPYPVREYPFGLYPPPFGTPMIRNIPQPGILLNPFVPPRNVPKDNINFDASQSPLVPAMPLPGVTPIVPPQIDNLTPETEIGVIVPPETSPEDVVPVEEPDAIKTPYAFGFDMNDGKGNDQHRKEVSDMSGSVTGSYSFRNGDGHYRIVYYAADKDGFRALVHSNEPGVASSGSANVVIVAGRPPPKVITEGPFPESKDDLTVAGSIQESQ